MAIKNILTFLFSILFLSAITTGLATSQESTVKSRGGAVFEKVAEIDGNIVPLRGYDLLTYWGFHVYSAAFYADVTSSEERQALASSTNRKLILSYHRSIDKKDIIKATQKSLEKNPDVSVKDLQERLDRLYATYHDVERDDRYLIVYNADKKKTSVYFNGELTCDIEGEDFATAFFGIWISENGLNEEVASQLRGE